MRFLVLSLLFCWLASCKSGSGEEGSAKTSDTIKVVQDPTPAVVSEPIISGSEFYYDSTNVGRKGQNKIVLEQAYRSPDSSLITVTFYTRKGENEWTVTQTLHFDREIAYGCDMKIPDFNNDGAGDVSFTSAIAARGANEVRTFLVYNSRKNELVHIVNSEDHPNLRYNEDAGCLEAMLFHGTFTHELLKLEGDSLREFLSANVVSEEGGERLYQEITFTDRKGNSRIVGKKEISVDDLYSGLDDPALIRKYRDR